MAKLVRITGMRRVIQKLKKAHKNAGGRFENGLKLAGLFVQRKSQEIVPVLTGNLKGGAFTRNIGGKDFDTDVIVGYVADYAVYVHEDLNAKHQPGKRAKFLEAAVREHKPEIFNIIVKG